MMFSSRGGCLVSVILVLYFYSKNASGLTEVLVIEKTGFAPACCALLLKYVHTGKGGPVVKGAG